jgi:hypothetical protein
MHAGCSTQSAMGDGFLGAISIKILNFKCFLSVFATDFQPILMEIGFHTPWGEFLEIAPIIWMLSQK